MHILDKIVSYKRKEVEKRISTHPIRLLEESAHFSSPTISLSEELKQGNENGIIAEFKRSSPSKGVLNANAKVKDVTEGYIKAGANGLSILTDEHFFGGSNEDLRIARIHNSCPILRKDFIVDPYQIVEAKSLGADLILLIAAVLSKREILEFSANAKRLGLEVLLEIHNEKELESLCSDVDILGVNNRNLNTFQTSIDVSKELADKIPTEFVKISESGIDSPEVVSELKEYGFQGFLIGERYMKEQNPAMACSKFISSFNEFGQ